MLVSACLLADQATVVPGCLVRCYNSQLRRRHAAQALQEVSLLPLKVLVPHQVHASLANLLCLFLSLQGDLVSASLTRLCLAGSSRASQPILSSNCGELQPLVGCSRRLSLETCFNALRCLCVTTTCVGLFITIAPMHLLTCLGSATLGLLHRSLYFVPIAAFKALQLSTHCFC